MNEYNLTIEPNEVMKTCHQHFRKILNSEGRKQNRFRFMPTKRCQGCIVFLWLNSRNGTVKGMEIFFRELRVRYLNIIG